MDMAALSLTEARKHALSELTDAQQTALDLYHGHHLGRPGADGRTADYRYWRGPQFEVQPGVSEAEARQAMAFVGAFQTALQRSFTSTNLVRDVADREISASTARLSWAARVGEEEELGALAQEADDLASDWWDTARRHPERVLREALTRARVSGAPSVLLSLLAPGAL